MSNVFTLDSLREETEKKFAPVKIALKNSEVELLSLLRMGKKARESVLSKIDDMKSIGVDEDADDLTDEENELLIESVADIFRTITTDSKQLLAELDGDDPMVKLALMMRVLTVWMEGAQVGEAHNSPS